MRIVFRLTRFTIASVSRAFMFFTGSRAIQYVALGANLFPSAFLALVVVITSLAEKTAIARAAFDRFLTYKFIIKTNVDLLKFYKL